MQNSEFIPGIFKIGVITGMSLFKLRGLLDRYTFRSLLFNYHIILIPHTNYCEVLGK